MKTKRWNVALTTALVLILVINPTYSFPSADDSSESELSGGVRNPSLQNWAAPRAVSTLQVPAVRFQGPVDLPPNVIRAARPAIMPPNEKIRITSENAANIARNLSRSQTARRYEPVSAPEIIEVKPVPKFKAENR